MFFWKRKAIAKKVEEEKKIFDWAANYPADSMHPSQEAIELVYKAHERHLTKLSEEKYFDDNALKLNPSIAARSINLDEFLDDLQSVFDKHGVSSLKRYESSRGDFRLGYDEDSFGMRSTQIRLK